MPKGQSWMKPSTKIFDGERFRIVDAHVSKREANKIAKRWRKKGYNARLQRFITWNGKKGYKVWIRKR